MPNKPPPPKQSNAVAPAPTRTYNISTGTVPGAAQRILLYGPGGIGKSTLAALAPEPVFLDVERGTNAIDAARVDGVETFADVRAVLQSDVLASFKTVAVDSATKIEELAVTHTLENTPTEKGDRPTSIEGYGYGKGLQHVYDTYLLLLADLDLQIRAGRNVIMIAHDCTSDVPNPVGEDYIRYEPHLQAPKSGKASIRNRMIQWADHVIFLGYDVISKDGKGKGGGTRTIWTTERPDHIAKSRTVAEALPFTSPTDSAIWDLIFQEA